MALSGGVGGTPAGTDRYPTAAAARAPAVADDGQPGRHRSARADTAPRADGDATEGGARRCPLPATPALRGPHQVTAKAKWRLQDGRTGVEGYFGRAAYQLIWANDTWRCLQASHLNQELYHYRQTIKLLLLNPLVSLHLPKAQRDLFSHSWGQITAR